MKNADKNRDPQRAQKRALSDARCAWRKMGAEQRVELLGWIGADLKCGWKNGTDKERVDFLEWITSDEADQHFDLREWLSTEAFEELELIQPYDPKAEIL